MGMHRVSLVIDSETWERIQTVKRSYGFLKDSEVLRFIIRKGLETVEVSVRG
ncbi:MAG: hypothetical protein F7C35_08210 [Desulfurococcales archaeon]|nr:hypothetical protein [Desulfurococcales archaeon]